MDTALQYDTKFLTIKLHFCSSNNNNNNDNKYTTNNNYK